MNPLSALSPGRRVNLDVALQRAVGIFQSQIALAAAEQRHEDVAGVLAHLDEGAEKELSRRHVYFTNRLLQRSLGRIEVVALGSEERETLGLLVVLLNCQWIHWA